MQSAGGPLTWLEASALGTSMRGSLWMYPIVEIFHIAGFVILVGSVVMFDLRLLGLSSHLPVTAMARHLLRWSILSVALVVPAGLMMFSAHPNDFISNPVFQLKLGLITTAVVNAVWFHVGVYRSVEDWNTRSAVPVTAKLHAALSIVLWFSVISCGRLLAYT